MRFFLAGIIQGGRTDTGIHSQAYRDTIRDAVAAVFPDAEFVDPHAENPDRLGWSRARQQELFLRYVAEAGRCDVLVAWLPEPSMGSAVEMFAAHRAGVPVLAITPMTGNWSVFSLATRCFPDVAAFATFLRGGEFGRLVAGTGDREVGAGGAEVAETINACADWQWNVNAWSKQDSPAAAINHYLAYRFAGAADRADRAFAWLCYGQRLNPTGAAAYRACRHACGDDGLYAAVLCAHGEREPDLAEAAVHLEWQAHNHPLSLVAAARAWQRHHAVEAMFAVLAGQAHNTNAHQLYRASFAEDPHRFFALVASHVSIFTADGHDHPYLRAGRPEATVLRDQVPSRSADTGGNGMP